MEEENIDRSRALSSLKAPAIILIIVGVISLLFQLYGLVAGQATADWIMDKVQTAAETAAEADPDMGEAERQQFEEMAEAFEEARAEAKMGPLDCALQGLGMLLSGLVIFGAMQMLNGRSWGLSLTACILVMIPCLGPCCGIFFPVGIWGIVVLVKDEVKQAMT